MTSLQLQENESYDIIQVLGGGNLSTVDKIIVKEDGKTYALKTIFLEKMKTKEEKEALLQYSIVGYNILKNNIENVVRVHGSYFNQEEDTFIFSMEYYPNNFSKHIHDIYENRKSFSLHEYMPFLLDMATGLRNLYINGNTIHKNLKPENILIRGGRASISDFCVANQAITKWMPPEILASKKEDVASSTVEINQSKIDVFSLGLISLYALDYENFNKHDDLNRDSCKLDKYLTSLKQSLSLPCKFYYILRCILSHCSSTRPDIGEFYHDITSFCKKYLSRPIKPQSNESAPVSSFDYDTCLQTKVDADIFQSFQNSLKEGISDQRSLMIESKLFKRDNFEQRNDQKLLLCSQKLEEFKSVLVLNVGLGNQRITDIGVGYLSAALQKMPLLILLKIELYSSDITDAGIAHINKALDKQQSLENLDIYLQPGSIQLANQISFCKSLETIGISFGNENISDSSIEAICKTVAQLSISHKLYRLQLYLNDAVSITDQSLKNLIKYVMIPNIKSLPTIKLYNTNDTKLSESEKKIFKKTYPKADFDTRIFYD